MNIFIINIFAGRPLCIILLREKEFLEFCTPGEISPRRRCETLFGGCIFWVFLRGNFKNPQYIVFCLFDYGVSVFTGILISAMVLKYGWTGLVGGICFLFPQYFFYGMIFVIVYIYLFRNAAIGNFYTVISRGWRGTHTLLKDRIIIILLIIGLFFVGCYIEAYISPSILKKIFGIFT